MTMMLLQQAQNKEYLNDCLNKLSDGKRIIVDAVEIKRLKEGRRALLEIQARIMEVSGKQVPVTLYGKVRFKGVDEKTFYLNAYLFENGFDAGSIDGISVPQPVALVPQVHMGLFVKANGQTVINHLTGPQREYYARKIVRVLFKLNRSRCPLHKKHTIEDELNILDRRMSTLLHQFPQWVNRLLYLKYQYRNIIKLLEKTSDVPIHRDFYHDQILINDLRLYLLDLDTCSLGDPALDLGNFLGHLHEHAVRNPDFLVNYQPVEDAMLEEFKECYPQMLPQQIRIYIFLTLVRHISISSQIPQRQWATERILTLCEHLIMQLNRGKTE